MSSFLIRRTASFGDPFTSILAAMTMMVGEVNFVDTFTKQNIRDGVATHLTGLMKTVSAFS